MNLDINDLKKLPVADKLRIVEFLWDDICESSEPIVLHAWQFEEAERRSADVSTDPSIMIDRHELWRRIDG